MNTFPTPEEPDCDVCLDTGEVDCEECGGMGCDDEGNDCDECSGSGQVPCYNC